MFERLRRLFTTDRVVRQSRVPMDSSLGDAASSEALLERAQARQQQGDIAGATELYDTLIRLEPTLAQPYYKRANLMASLGRLDEALAGFDRAIALDPAHTRAFCNRGLVLERLGRDDLALSSYDTALRIDGGDSLPHYNRGAVLRRLGRLDDAISSYDAAIRWSPQFAEAFVNRGNVLQELHLHQAAVDSFDRALALKPAIPQALVGRAKSLFALKRLDLAMAAFDLAVSHSPSEEVLLGLRCETRMYACAWQGFESDRARIVDALEHGRLACAPLLSVMLLDVPSVQHKAAQLWVRDQVCREELPSAHRGQVATRLDRSAKLHLAYFSADFRAHPVANLMAGLIERHDRSRFDVTAFAFGPRSTDSMALRQTQAFDRVIDVRSMSDVGVAETARQMRTDIAVDLNGFTEHGRPGIFALRAAPIQVNFLGYPGTMGADFMDYLIADQTVVPQAMQQHFTEKIAYLPNCFMPFDQSYAISGESPSREAEGVSTARFVFCCFNNHYKILPQLFEQWMNILRRTPDSILWLRQAGDVVTINLREEARKQGVDAERLVFAGYAESSATHLARLRLADLFLDTFPYNAHATAMDALWAGVPVLTRAGECFASRVASSLLRTAGLEELVAVTSSQYEDLAVELASDAPRLAMLRLKLAQRESSLFDTAAYTRNLEALYVSMLDRSRAGFPPAHIFDAVPLEPGERR